MAKRPPPALRPFPFRIIQSLNTDQDTDVIDGVDHRYEHEEGHQKDLEAPVGQCQYGQSNKGRLAQIRNAFGLEQPHEQAEGRAHQKAEDEGKKLERPAAEDRKGHDHGEGCGGHHQIGRVDRDLLQITKVHAGKAGQGRLGDGHARHQHGHTTNFRREELPQTGEQPRERRFRHAKHQVHAGKRAQATERAGMDHGRQDDYSRDLNRHGAAAQGRTKGLQDRGNPHCNQTGGYQAPGLEAGEAELLGRDHRVDHEHDRQTRMLQAQDEKRGQRWLIIDSIGEKRRTNCHCRGPEPLETLRKGRGMLLR